MCNRYLVFLICNSVDWTGRTYPQGSANRCWLELLRNLGRNPDAGVVDWGDLAAVGSLGGCEWRIVFG